LASTLARAGGYELLGELGRGGFGVVYDARRHDDGQPAAVKVLHADLVRSGDLVSRFYREVEVCRRLHHPGVVRILDLGQLEDGRPYFAMERLWGEDLAARLAQVGAFSALETGRVLDAVGGALSAAHRAGVIHRDVKASNVFFCSGEQRVVLLDFGVAKLIDGEGGEGALTTSWEVLGTPAYRAPEQVGGRANERSDVYALGALLFHMLTGALPFCGSSSTMVQQLHRHAQRPRPSAQAGVDPAFDEVVMRAMAPAPEQRYAGVDELCLAYRRALGRHLGVAAPAAGGRRCARALAVHLDIEPIGDERQALDEVERIWAAARRWFAEDGFQLVFVASQTLVVAIAIAGEEAEPRRRASDTIAELEQGADRSRVRLRAVLGSGEAVFEGDELLGGAIMELGRWVPA
jgi:serine/threonine-protein kinase